MELVEPQAWWMDKIKSSKVLGKLEVCGRVCYKSEDRMTKDSHKKFVKAIVRREHLSVTEHESFTARFVCSRGCSHELVRHRLASFSQESTRYCDYGKKGIALIYPYWLRKEMLDDILKAVEEKQDPNLFNVLDKNNEFIFIKHMYEMEKVYNLLRELGRKPEEARAVLPIQLKTEVIVSANIREWLHIFKMRDAHDAHPEIRMLVHKLKEEFQAEMPELFKEEKIV